VLPHPPALVPEVSVQSPDWLHKLRVGCLESVGRLMAAVPDVVVVVGSAAEAGRWDTSAGGSMRAYGVDVRAGSGGADLPLSLTVGAWALDRAGWNGPREYVAVDRALGVRDAGSLGAELVADRRVALLVMGDGSAKRSKQAPGYLDERAAGFDAEVVAAIAQADPAAIGRLDAGLADELWVAGLPAWRVLAGALDGRTESLVRYDEAPTGVGYFVIDLVVG
jgi:hypothetical protein